MSPLQASCAPTIPPTEVARDRALAAFITQLISLATGVSAPDIAATGRSVAPASRARQLAMYLAHIGCGWSVGRVALAFGRDRSTVTYACQKVEDLRDDPRLDDMLEACEAALRLAPQAGAPLSCAPTGLAA